MNHDSRAVEFPTRVDNGLLAVVVGSLVVSFAAMVMAAREDPTSAAIGVLILLASTALILVLSVPTSYIIGQEELVIRSGFVRYRIPLRSIQRVYPTRNPLSAPAWSLRRLGIDYDRERHRRGFALISPERQEDFLRLLAARAGLARVGKELRREG